MSNLDAESNVPSLRIAILNTGPTDLPNLGGYNPLFVNMLNQIVSNPIIDLYDVKHENDYLSNLNYNIFVITGSIDDAHAVDNWIVILKEHILNLYNLKKKILGICFGHQLISNVFNGYSNKSGIWELGVRKLSFTEKAKELYGEIITSSDNYNIYEVHQDQVLKLPPMATLLAFSCHCPYEIYGIDELVLCIQGHPEFSKDVVEECIKEDLVSNSISLEIALDARNSIGSNHVDNLIIRDIIKMFMYKNI